MRFSFAFSCMAALVSGCMSPADQRARDFVTWDARSDAANTAADRCGGEALPIEGHKGYAPDDYRCPPGALVDVLDRLAGAPDGSLHVSDLAAAFGRSFEHVERNGYGEKYVAAPIALDFAAELFVLPDQEFRLSLTQMRDQRIADWRSRLLDRGWVDAGTIRHPFVQDSFRKGDKQIRIEHNMDVILSVTVLGLNASTAE